jgi:TatA/E family protein of Tat protein translocase
MNISPAMFGIGAMESVVIIVVLVAIIGPTQLPRMAESVAKSLKIFRKTAAEMKEPLREIEAEIQGAADEAKSINEIGEKKRDLRHTST